MRVRPACHASAASLEASVPPGELCSKFGEDRSMNNVTILSTDAGRTNWTDCRVASTVQFSTVQLPCPRRHCDVCRWASEWRCHCEAQEEIS